MLLAEVLCYRTICELHYLYIHIVDIILLKMLAKTNKNVLILRMNEGHSR